MSLHLGQHAARPLAEEICSRLPRTDCGARDGGPLAHRVLAETLRDEGQSALARIKVVHKGKPVRLPGNLEAEQAGIHTFT